MAHHGGADAGQEESDIAAEDIDAEGLPDRLFRKAETAIQGRTTRILAVIERCTDEHNYSAIIRTAEALGVQHIWLIDPVVSEHDVVDNKMGAGVDDEEEEEGEGIVGGGGGSSGVGTSMNRPPRHRYALQPSFLEACGIL